MLRTWVSVVMALAVVLGPGRAYAGQASRAGAMLLHVEGAVYLDDRLLEANSPTPPLADGAVVRTTSGRAAVGLKRGGVLFLDAASSVRIRANAIYNFNRIEDLSGSAIVTSGTSMPVVDCESDIRLSDVGLFRFDAQRVTSTGERPCRFRVFDGAAAVPLASVTVALRSGQTMVCNRRCGDMIPVTEFPRDQIDDFDRWVRQMRERFSA